MFGFGERPGGGLTLGKPFTTEGLGGNGKGLTWLANLSFSKSSTRIALDFLFGRAETMASS